jgi:hypothetical protein
MVIGSCVVDTNILLRMTRLSDPARFNGLIPVLPNQL